MSFQISINGQAFNLWESATVQRTIDANCGSFRFMNSSTTPLSEYPVKAGDFVQVLIDGKSVITGFIDEISDNLDDGYHIISISGRDNVQDLIDSSVPDSAKVEEGPISLEKLCENVITAIGAEIKVISDITLDDFNSEDLQASFSGGGCMEYLVNFARKRQVYLVSDGSGNLLIYRPDKTNKASSPIINLQDNRTNNILTYSVVRSQQNRFNKYLCRSQDNFGFSLDAEYEVDGTDRKGEVTDSQIRASRYIEIPAEESMSDDECLERAKEDANVRRANGLEYTATVAGTTQINGTVWDFGQFINVQDDFANVKGEFLIKAVEYSVDVDAGTRTTLTIVPTDAYQVLSEPSDEDKRTSDTGTAYQEPAPKQQSVNIR